MVIRNDGITGFKIGKKYLIGKAVPSGLFSITIGTAFLSNYSTGTTDPPHCSRIKS